MSSILHLVWSGAPPPWRLIKESMAWIEYMPSHWLIKTSETTEWWQEHLMPADQLGALVFLVSEVDPDAMGGYLPGHCWDWVRRHKQAAWAAKNCTNCDDRAQEWGGPEGPGGTVPGWCRACGAFYRAFWVEWGESSIGMRGPK